QEESGPELASQWETTVEEVKARRDRGEDFMILDVRNAEEWQICHLEGATLLPLGELPARVHELDSARDMVVHCKSGIRSAKAVAFLLQAGFRKVKNVRGGITEWSRKIDPRVPLY